MTTPAQQDTAPRRSWLARQASAEPTLPMRFCAVIPTYNNPATIVAVVEAVRIFVPDVIVVDDGSATSARRIIAALGADGRAVVVHRARNGGKGAAVRSGLDEAAARGYTHAVQVDADGQHDLAAIPALLAAATAHPNAAIIGRPVFDATAPKARLRARRITEFWVHVETFGRVIDDAMVGFRVYPVHATRACGARGNRMDFDIEVAVRLAWAGVPIVNVPVAVRYLSAEQGGVSHFRVVRDNLLISWLHTRLTTLAILRALARLLLGSKHTIAAATVNRSEET